MKLAREDSADAPMVSVVMVAYNTGPVLYRAIESVLEQPELLELILVNNGNPPEMVAKLAQLARADTRLTLITPPNNRGFAGGCNIGAKAASGEYLLLLNPDCILPQYALKLAVDELDKHPEAYVAGCRIMNPDNTEQGGSRRQLLTPWIALVEGMNLYHIAPEKKLFSRINLHPVESNTAPSFVPAISGAFMLIKTKNYHLLGGIDEKYFFHVEDLDFCFQIHKQGKKILYIPEVKVVHYRSTSKVSPFFIEWNKAKGFSRYFSKNFRDMYFPGFISLIIMAIYLRLCLRSMKLLIKKIFYGNLSEQSDASLSDAAKRASLLESYSTLPTDNNYNKGVLEQSPIFLAGASGQVGLAILRRLLATGAKVTGLYHIKAIDFSHENFTWKQGDLNSGKLDLDGVHAKTLIYTPALWLLPPLLESFHKAGVRRLVCFSSTSVFAKANSGNAYEKWLVSKFIWAEHEIAAHCAELGIQWTIFRPTLIYGVGFDYNVSSIVRFIKRFGFFPVVKEGLGLRQPVHVDDLALAVLTVLDKPVSYNKCFNLCGGEQITYREMVGRIFDAMRRKRMILTLKYLPLLLDIYSTLFRKPDINGEIALRMNHDLVFDDNEAQQAFGYNPRKFLAAGINDLEPDYTGIEK
jgi:GT2 family glycosyltransferase/nucleoside-diphosphate-sugar epimerase